MGDKKCWKERLTDSLDLPGEPLPGVPLIELAGDRRVLIECHSGVTEYGREKVTVRVSYGSVSVCGQGLELASMGHRQLVITGMIHSVALCRKEH